MMCQQNLDRLTKFLYRTRVAGVEAYGICSFLS